MKRIDEYIQRQRQIQPSADLHQQIMRRIADVDNAQAAPSPRFGAWRTVAVAASFALVMFLGIRLGDIMTSESSELTAQSLIINDDTIENLTIITTDEQNQ